MKKLKFWVICIITYISIYWISAILVSSSSFINFESGMLTMFTLLPVILCIWLISYFSKDKRHTYIGCGIQITLGLVIGFFIYYLSIAINSSLDPFAKKQYSAIINSLFATGIFQYAFMFTLLVTNKKK